MATGKSIVSIARNLNERCIPTKGSNSKERKHWHSLTIRRMIKNTSYIGKTYFGVTSRLSKSKTVTHPREKWILLENVTPLIIDEELFSQANAELDKPKVVTGCPKNEYLLRNHAFCAICGKPLVGHCLGKKHRYYQCNSARAYENHGKMCNALYIRANDLEELVWARVKEVLSNPEIVLKELSNTTDSDQTDLLDAEIKTLEKNLRNYEERRRNLLEAMELGEFEKNEVLDRLNKVKRLQVDDETKLNDLKKSRAHIESLANASVKIDELYDRVMSNLQNCTPELKALALNALDIKVFAEGTDKVEIQGVIPLELALPTTEQTSA